MRYHRLAQIETDDAILSRDAEAGNCVEEITGLQHLGILRRGLGVEHSGQAKPH